MKPTKALAKKPAVPALTLAALRASTMSALEGLATAITTVKPEEYRPAWDFVRKMQETVADMESHLKKVIEGFVLEHGREWGEKGGRQVTFPDGQSIQLRLHRTGVDARKLEKLLRTRNIDPAKCMNAKVTYTVDEEKVAQSVREGLLTDADVASTYYDATWVVQR